MLGFTTTLNHLRTSPISGRPGVTQKFVFLHKLGRYKLPRFRQIFGPFLSDWLSEFRLILRGGKGGVPVAVFQELLSRPPSSAPFCPLARALRGSKIRVFAPHNPSFCRNYDSFRSILTVMPGPAHASAVRTVIFLTYGHRRTPGRGAAEGSA